MDTMVENGVAQLDSGEKYTFRTLWGLLKDTFRLFGKNPWSIVTFSLICGVVSIIIAGVLETLFYRLYSLNARSSFIDKTALLSIIVSPFPLSYCC